MAAAEENLSLNALIGKAIEDYISKNNERHRHFAEALLNKITRLTNTDSPNPYKKAEISTFGVVQARDDAFGIGRNKPDAGAITIKHPSEFGAF